MASVVLLTVALMPPRDTLVLMSKPPKKSKKPKAIASVELILPDDAKAQEVFFRIAAEFKHIAEALDPEALAATLLEGEVPGGAASISVRPEEGVPSEEV
jgi:hypothetical protein